MVNAMEGKEVEVCFFVCDFLHKNSENNCQDHSNTNNFSTLQLCYTQRIKRHM